MDTCTTYSPIHAQHAQWRHKGYALQQLDESHKLNSNIVKQIVTRKQKGSTNQDYTTDSSLSNKFHR